MYQLLLIDETIIVLKDKLNHHISPLAKRQNEELIEKLKNLKELIEHQKRKDGTHPITNREVVFASEMFLNFQS